MVAVGPTPAVSLACSVRIRTDAPTRLREGVGQYVEILILPAANGQTYKYIHTSVYYCHCHFQAKCNNACLRICTSPFVFIDARIMP